uniref:Uncharacterized protein n=1 Tax=viral metagenome TaxID=1070528 RepID=A0A6M3XZS6_9ZZZZ
MNLDRGYHREYFDDLCGLGRIVDKLTEIDRLKDGVFIKRVTVTLDRDTMEREVLYEIGEL